MTQEANRLLAAGQYSEAADLLGVLAGGAEERGKPGWAGNFLILNGQALAALGARDEALMSIRRGFDLLHGLGRPRQLHAAGHRLVAWLRANHQPEMAETVQAMLDEMLGPVSMPRAEETASARRRGTLPPKCPNCGGTVHPDEVEWIEPEGGAANDRPESKPAAECAYCGSILYATNA